MSLRRHNTPPVSISIPLRGLLFSLAGYRRVVVNYSVPDCGDGNKRKLSFELSG